MSEVPISGRIVKANLATKVAWRFSRANVFSAAPGATASLAVREAVTSVQSNGVVREIRIWWVKAGVTLCWVEVYRIVLGGSSHGRGSGKNQHAGKK